MIKGCDVIVWNKYSFILDLKKILIVLLYLEFYFNFIERYVSGIIVYISVIGIFLCY